MVQDRDFKSLAKDGNFGAFKAAWEDGGVDLGTAFERAVTDFRTVKRNDGHLAILKFCIDQGLDPASRVDWLGQTVVNAAAMYGNNEIVDYMQSKGLPESPFIRASIGDVAFIETLSQRNDLKDLNDRNGFNLLHYVAASGLGRTSEEAKRRLTEACRLLIEHDVRTDAVIEKEIPITPALMCAWFGGNGDIMKSLLEKGEINVGELHQALEFTMEPHQRSGEPFFVVAKEILVHGFDVDSIRKDQQRAVLHGAAHRGATNAVRWLLENLADPNVTDGQNRTPLHMCAIRNSHASVAKLLLEFGADASRVDDSGRTPLDYARENGRDKVAAMLES